MKVAVISDLHLGRGDAADLFGHDEAEFLRFLTFLEANFERIVLLGDVYETLTSPKPFAQADELKACMQAHPEIVRRFERPPYTYIHGNHDLVAGQVGAAPSELYLNVDGTRLLFQHGHGYDWLLRRARSFSEWSVWAGGWLLRLGMRPMFRMFEKLDFLIRGAKIDPKICSFQSWAVGLAKRRDADVIVTGHTHMGTRAEHGDRLFLNSGSCAEGAYSWLSIDTKAGHYAVNTSW